MNLKFGINFRIIVIFLIIVNWFRVCFMIFFFKKKWFLHKYFCFCVLMLFWISNISDNIIWIQHASSLGTALVNLITPIEYFYLFWQMWSYIFVLIKCLHSSPCRLSRFREFGLPITPSPNPTNPAVAVTDFWTSIPPTYRSFCMTSFRNIIKEVHTHSVSTLRTSKLWSFHPRKEGWCVKVIKRIFKWGTWPT